MTKILMRGLVCTVLLSSLVPSISLAATGIRATTAAQVQPVLLSFVGQLQNIQGQLVSDQNWMAQARTQLGLIAVSLQAVSQSNLNDAANRTAAVSMLQQASVTVQGMGQQLTTMQNRRETQVNVLSQLTDKFRLLIGLVMALPE